MEIHEKRTESIWQWKNLEVSWCKHGDNLNNLPSLLLIHGFGACKEHWRFNQPALGEFTNCFSLDLIGFGKSSQPKSKIIGEQKKDGNFNYCFDNWANQVSEFSKEIIKGDVILIGNSIGGVIALRAAQLLKNTCKSVVLINCAQRQMDDKRLNEMSIPSRLFRPVLKTLVRKRWLSKNLFRNAANTTVIKNVLKQAYPSGSNVNDELIQILLKPSQREGAPEAFRGFINLFDDYLAPQLISNLTIPIDMIWGESDPWEPLSEAKKWKNKFSTIRSFTKISNAGHCPHDESPELVNQEIIKIIQQAT
tara:strand:+ start:10236 stop:11156 length:921 start_codon:yes stop_codon:yes gene_type:complete